MPAVTAPTKRTPVKETAAYKAIEAKAAAAMKRARGYHASLVEKRIPDALMGIGAASGTAIVGGAIRGVLGPKVLGVPLDVPLAVLGTAIAIPSGLLGFPLGIHAGSGLVLPALSNLTETGTRGAISAIMQETFGGLLGDWSEWDTKAA
jgi:hypothetical protein